MSIVNNTEKIISWAEEFICSKIKLKIPDDDSNDGKYNYKLVNPAVFALFVPTKDRLPPKAAAPIPSLCVQIIDGKDMPNSGTTRIRFGFSTWSPGTHGMDIFAPKPGEPGKYTQPDTDEGRAFYKRNSEGWRDAWNFVDLALREIESAEIIGGLLRVVKEDGITYGPYTEQDSILDCYPYWYAWVEFTVSYGITRQHPQYDHYL